MFSVSEHWNPKQKLLRNIILKEDKFSKAIDIILDLHSIVHSCDVSSRDIQTLEDQLWDGLDIKAFVTMPTLKDVTIAWNIWYITRIEDLTVNLLIADEIQEFNCKDWSAKLNIKVSDTGNAMTKNEIIDFSLKINLEELRNYRMAVGRRTRNIILNLEPTDMRKKVQKDRLQRIFDEDGVLDVEDSKWLLDFWGKKNIAGLILMPLTRHQVVHLNDSLKLKKKFSRMR
ncbi:DinB family protein [Herbivorax sp. ANBcel31]|uniref:DinB family protein n=1 Tax=Herbivorax sp. ANBcel31 TaxID=3069754 RepID=UPI0027AE0DCB|nr:DinB family protein [Herbivorax sp. ANBcel31]MDQ2086982.1 DinB family protein [Herbivorax sp. ANBcel31]